MRWVAGLVISVLLAACGSKPSATAGECGDGIVDAGEACDDGAQNGTGGCTISCTFACGDPAIDCAAAPACQIAICTAGHVCMFIADASQDGASCGASQVCNAGACVSDGTCGNGVKEGVEDCDFGSGNGLNTGCELDCTFSCANQAACDDGNACNGVETCDAVTVSGQTGQKCSVGTALDSGASCGAGMICIGAACTAATCGDGYTTSPEECDDANATPGDGCESDCTYSCVSTDAARNCTPTDACAGQGTCNETTHQCTAGSPLPDDTMCGTGGYCKAATCTQPVCPNGDLEPGEVCDDGNPNNGDGCDNDCTRSCTNPATDCGSPPACQTFTCTTGYTCQAVADATKDGTSCGTNGETCNSGACTSGVCGNAILESGEQCDFGTGNGPGTGCESNCTFSCTMLPNSCDDGNACNGSEACTAVTVMGRAGQRCTAGTPLPDNSSCGSGTICRSQQCVTSECGDGYIDTMIGESCEPPNTMSCDAACHAVVCGDGVRAGPEQCDDGNMTNLDGCNASCKFEQCHRFTDLDIQFATSASCPANALGGAAVHQDARNMITAAIDNGVADGSISVIFQMLDLDNLAGTSEPSLRVGVLRGTPASGTGYSGNSDLDWWYTIDQMRLDATRTPTQAVQGSIANGTLSTLPGNMTFNVNFVGVAVTMDMFDTTLTATIGAATTPLASTGGSPGHLASEHLDPTLTSFATMTQGEVCGSTTAASLANTHVPASLAQTCTSYTTAHSLLDVFVGGCTVFFGLVEVIKASQPDSSRDGATYRFFTNAQRYVDRCERDGVVTPMAECLQNAGYTSYYKFTTDRVIGK